MPNPILQRPLREATTSASAITRPSLYNTKDEFIQRIAPVASAAIYFGSFSLAMNDVSLSRQALFKLSFLHRHYLQHAGLQIVVEKNTATFSGPVINPHLITLAEILARQIDGITVVKDETQGARTKNGTQRRDETVRESIQLLFATDQTLHAGVQVSQIDGALVLEGETHSTAQQHWAEQLAEAAGGKVDSQLTTSTFTPPPMLRASEPPRVDDESLQALILFRLLLVRETEALTLKVTAVRGVVTLQGKVPSGAVRQLVENIARSTLGIRELRSTLSVSA